MSAIPPQNQVASVTQVRPATDSDVPAIAGMFHRIFRHAAAPAPTALADYLRSIFVSGPDRDADLPSLVCESGDGGIGGFIGVIALPMALGETRLQAAVCCCLMVERSAGDPLAGAKLLRKYLAGPQDISVSETASDTASNMFQGARGTVLPAYSLEWLRVLNPARFAVELGGERLAALRLLAPLAVPFDALSRRRAAGALRWTSLASREVSSKGAVASAVDASTFAQLVPDLLEGYDLHPDWPAATLHRLLNDAARKADWGDVVRQVVSTASGKAIGAFLYHARPGGVGRVLQVLHRPGQAGTVVDAMLDHGVGAGLAAMRGRTQPALLKAMLGKRIAFSHVASSVVHARNPDHLRQFVEGRAFFNGLAGDTWTRLIGDRLE